MQSYPSVEVRCHNKKETKKKNVSGDRLLGLKQATAKYLGEGTVRKQRTQCSKKLTVQKFKNEQKENGNEFTRLQAG